MESKKRENIESMFDDIAKRYDLLNHLLSMRFDVAWRNKVVKLLKKHKPNTILDVATGTGDMAIAALNSNPQKVIGLDISLEMLNVAKIKINQKNVSDKIELVKGDSENIPYDDNYFDAVTVCFGVRNFENLEKGISEIYRVLKPNGMLLIIEFSKPTNPLINFIYNFYFSKALPFVGKIISKNQTAYNYLYKSASEFPKDDAFVKILNSCNFKNSSYKHLSQGIVSLYIAYKH